jgi:nucleoside-diphosphate-sugar epimerase
MIYHSQAMNYQTVIMFGGTGFIGSHFARYLLERNLARECILADLKPLRMELLPQKIRDRITYCRVDVRSSISESELPYEADLIVNLAAVHREPGHEPHEYFETNIRGAENVCAYAAEIDCRKIIFTSSIAPYGPSQELKTEKSLPVPQTPYGASKLAAEKIHFTWLNGDENRRLIIARPGVVFGRGEGGNVTRMIRAVLKRYFFYMGNKEVRKAGGYVKDLCHAMWWVLERMELNGQSSELFNFTLDPPPSIEEYVAAICRVSNVRRVILNVPYPLIIGLSWIVSALARPLHLNHPFSPVRVRKLVSYNFIDPLYLRENNYPWQYGLIEALEDWRSEHPGDWGIL